MPQLTRPATAVHASFLEAMAELAAEGAGGPGDSSTAGREVRTWDPEWSDPEVFRGYVESVRAGSRPGPGQGPGLDPGPGPCSGAGSRIPRTTWWYVEGDAFLGRIALRHALAPGDGERNGRIGYFVRPTARRRGHASAMLSAVLPLAHAAGIDPALVTCDTANAVSRRVIEGCGGLFRDVYRGKLRFLVPTGGSAWPLRLQG